MKTDDFMGYVRLADRHPEMLRFNGIELDDIDLSRSNWNNKIKLTNSIFTNINFDQSRLIGVDFTGTTFIDCTFFDSDLSEVIFDDTKFIRCNFDKANFGNASFRGSDLSGFICDNSTWACSDNEYTPERIFDEVFSMDIPNGQDGRLVVAAISHAHVPLKQLELFVERTENESLKKLAKKRLSQRSHSV
jgi:hypothetical protein